MIKATIKLWLMAAIAVIATAALQSCSDEPEISLPEETSAPQTALVTQSQAQDVAALFATDRYGVAPVKSRSSQAVETVYNISGDPVAYVVNNEGGGWVIVSASKNFHPILAYSDRADASFRLADSNPGLDMWLDDVRQAVTDSEQLPDSTARQIALEWLQYETITPFISRVTPPGPIPGGNDAKAVACRNRLKELNETYYKEGWKFMILSSVREVTVPDHVYATADIHGCYLDYTIMGYRDVSTRIDVGPLLTTLWHQGTPGSTTDFNAMCPNHSVAGCVPIAMAQIMRYYRFPDQFDWDYMEDKVATNASQYLIADIGKTIKVDYKGDEASSNAGAALDGFRTYGYAASLQDYDHNATINYRYRRLMRPIKI